MARKAAELEGAILELYRRLDAATPAMHKRAAGNGRASATASLWVKILRAGCQLVSAGVELGDHYRRVTQSTKPGPIRESLGEDGLQRIQEHAAAGGNTANAEETQRLHAALQRVADKLPDRASIQNEIEWVGANLHDPQPDFDKAPSRTAINLLLDVAHDERMRREFWTIVLGKRLSPGEPRPKPKTFMEDEVTDASAAEYDAELERRLSGAMGDHDTELEPRLHEPLGETV